MSQSAAISIHAVMLDKEGDGSKGKHTVALAADFQLGALFNALVDQEHDLVKLLLGHLRSMATSDDSQFSNKRLLLGPAS